MAPYSSRCLSICSFCYYESFGINHQSHFRPDIHLLWVAKPERILENLFFFKPIRAWSFCVWFWLNTEVWWRRNHQQELGVQSVRESFLTKYNEKRWSTMNLQVTEISTKQLYEDRFWDDPESWDYNDFRCNMENTTKKKEYIPVNYNVSKL